MAATVGLTLEHVGTVASELADRLGFNRVTVSALARELGVKPASLYAHVRGLDALREIIGTRAHAVLAADLTRATAGLHTRAALAAAAEAMLEMSRRHPGLWQASRAHFAGEEFVAAGRRVSAILGGVIRGYGLPASEVPHAVRIIGSSIGGFIGLDDTGGFSHSDPETATSWQRLIDVLDGALSHWPTAPGTATAAGTPDGRSASDATPDAPIVTTDAPLATSTTTPTEETR
ncbi:TetR/AcrR family transcriptional regulator [Mycetocola sp. JXN-3]|uniref:TetR/AcrR family transcriptional regulator n=1 Tax=Mycetocola sp. JXN-3 TaxID=2116510 RepID=UPI00165D2354|nr:TetR/AcrR family transcriptional regulator [Mycetocola sp. JXN-3]